MIKTCCLLLVGGLAAQHSMLSLFSDHHTALLLASLGALSWRPARALAVFGCGYALFLMAGQNVIDMRLEPAFEGDSMLTEVRVSDFPSVSDGSVVMDIEASDDARIPQRVRVSWFEPPVVPRLGDVWQLEIRLRQPRGTFNPGVFDYESWMFREKYGASGYVVGGKRNQLIKSGNLTRLEQYRIAFVATAANATESDSAAAILAAIGVGARHAITRQQWEEFAASGTSHLMAISGLHVGLAAFAAFGIAFGLCGPWLRCNTYVVAIVTGTVCAVVYALVSGFGVPARRATVMLAVVGFTLWQRRQINSAAAVAAAGIIVFLSDPIATMRPGFHLSFAAVVLLLWFARQKAGPRKAGRIVHASRQLFAMQVFLLIGLFPLTTVIFQRFSIAATPVNFLAVPVFSFLTVPLTLAGMVSASFSSPVAAFLLRIAAHSIDAITRLIQAVIDLPFASIALAEVQGVAWCLVIIPLAWVVLPRGWPGRQVALLGVLAMVLWRPAAPPEDCFDTWVLDVGQGLAVTVQTNSATLLYDTGMAWRGGGSSAAQVVLPFLRSRRIDTLDWLVVSHSDLDHSGGVSDILDAMHAHNVLVGESLELGQERACIAGQSWMSGHVRFDVLHPRNNKQDDGNAVSCVLRVSVGPYGLLLTGDIEAPSERELVQTRATLAADIALVPHHGSQTSSSVPFIDSVYPDFAVVSAGHGNRWGFPKAPVVARWEAMGAEVLNTGSSGALYFRVCGEEGVVRMRREREDEHRFWHAET